MVQIRFKSLPKLINSMKKLGWIIDSFQFKYKNELYFVILKLYSENENRPTRYTQVKLEFIKASNISESIHATADFYEVHFTSVNEFVNFFGISSGNANRDLFIDFSDIFSKFIPSVKQEVKSGLLRKLQGSRCEGNNPKAIYCYDVRRNGETNNRKNSRSLENSNKAFTLRKNLYNKFKDDENLSFFFSDKPDDEKTDAEIISQFSKRNSRP